MQQLGLKSKVRIKRYRSYRGPVGKKAPNLLARDFHASRPNIKWVTDVTEFKVQGRKLYLSPVMDLFNGEILAYELSDRPVLKMVTEMIRKAFGDSGTVPGQCCTQIKDGTISILRIVSY